VRILFVIDGRARGEQLRRRLLDLGHHGAHGSGFRLMVRGPGHHAPQAAADRQQQGRVIPQLQGQDAVQAFQLLHHTAEQRQLLLDRHVVIQHLLQARHQPGNRRRAGTQLERMHLIPMVLAQVAQHPQARQQARERLALVQRPGQPGGDPQILGLMTQQGFALFLDLQPVDLAAGMHRLRFAQLVFQGFKFIGEAYVVARETVLVHKGLGELEVMGVQLAGIAHAQPLSMPAIQARHKPLFRSLLEGFAKVGSEVRTGTTGCPFRWQKH